MTHLDTHHVASRRAALLGAPLRALLLLGLISVAMGASTAAAEPSGYLLSEGRVRFFCEGPQVTLPAWGQFAAVASSVTFDAERIEKTTGAAEVLLTSVNTKDSGWDAVFRSAEFLGLEEFPKSTFIVRSVTPAGEVRPGTWVPVNIRGAFVLHGVQKEITVPGSVRWSSLSGGAPETLEVRSYFKILWADYNIPVPTGITRTFAGDGAGIQVELSFVRSRRKPAPKTK